MVLECSHLRNYFCTSNVFVTIALSFLPLDDVSIKMVRIWSLMIKLSIYWFLLFYLISNIIPFLPLFFSFLAPYFSFNLSWLRHMLFFLSKTGVAFMQSWIEILVLRQNNFIIEISSNVPIAVSKTNFSCIFPNADCLPRKVTLIFYPHFLLLLITSGRWKIFLLMNRKNESLHSFRIWENKKCKV